MNIFHLKILFFLFIKILFSLLSTFVKILLSPFIKIPHSPFYKKKSPFIYAVIPVYLRPARNVKLKQISELIRNIITHFIMTRKFHQVKCKTARRIGLVFPRISHKLLELQRSIAKLFHLQSS